MEYLVIYRKDNNVYLYRTLRSYFSENKIGERTSAGWFIVDVQQFYNGRYYNFREYTDKINKDFEKKQKREKIERIVKNKIDFVLYHNFNIKRKYK